MNRVCYEFRYLPIIIPESSSGQVVSGHANWVLRTAYNLDTLRIGTPA